MATCRPTEGDAVSGRWHLLVHSAGVYDVELRRYPREANTALGAPMPEVVPRFGKPEPAGISLPIAGMSLSCDGDEEQMKTHPSDTFASFRVHLAESRASMTGKFVNEEGEDVCIA